MERLSLDIHLTFNIIKAQGQKIPLGFVTLDEATMQP
jgi:hypothetical protein